MSNMIRKVKELIKKTKLWKKYTSTRTRVNSEEYINADKMLENAGTIVDLGCGTSPYYRATVAVDKYIEPIHRKFGANKKIDVAEIENQGIRFVEADFEELPFEDKSFDVAYSHHVVEHLDNPAKAMQEMQRIAKAGVIMCPSLFAEYIFGREYHKWLITYREDLLIFIEKDWREPWFGEGPTRIKNRVVKSKDCNPFDILLNDGNWYHGIHRYKRLTKKLQFYWCGHFKNMENVFVWKNKFRYLIIYKDGHTEISE